MKLVQDVAHELMGILLLIASEETKGREIIYITVILLEHTHLNLGTSLQTMENSESGE